MDHDRVDTERIGNLARMLSAGAAEARERELRDVVAALDRDVPDRVRHALDRDADRALCDALRALREAGRRLDLGRERGETRRDDVEVDRLVRVRSERVREEVGLDAPEQDVRVGDRQRAAVPIARGSGPRAGRLRTDREPPAAERDDRAAAGRDRVNPEHRGRDAHARDLGVLRALELAGEERHVRRRAAHVEAEHAREAGRARRRDHADHAARRSRQDAVFAAEALGARKTAVALHEVERYAGAEQLVETCAKRLDVATQHRRQIRVDERRVAARHELLERDRLVRQRYLGEAQAPRDLAGAPLVVRETVRVQERDRDRVDALGAERFEIGRERRLVERLDDVALCGHALARFDDARVEHRRHADVEREDVGPLLRADLERVAQARRDHERGRLAAPLEQRVRRDRRAHADGGDASLLRRAIGEQAADALDGRVRIAARIRRQELERSEPSLGVARDYVGERAAAIDPEMPAVSHEERMESGRVCVHAGRAAHYRAGGVLACTPQAAPRRRCSPRPVLSPRRSA